MALEVLRWLLFNGDEQRPRAGWRVLGQAVVLLLMLVVAGPVLFAVLPWLDAGDLAGVGAEELLLLGPAVLAPLFLLLLACTIASVWLAARLLDRRPLTEFGLRLDRLWWRELGLGAALGAGLMLVVFVFQVAVGWVDVTATATDPASGPVGWLLLGALVQFGAIGVYEEVLTRGYQLTNFSQGLRGLLGPRLALLGGWLIAGVLFGLLHLVNPGATKLSTLNIVVAGLFLGLGYLVTGRLGLPIGLHVSWNFFQGPVFGFPVSGISPGETTLFEITQGGPELLTGGAFGPEGGLIGLLALIAGSAVLLWWARRQPDDTGLRLGISEAPEPTRPRGRHRLPG